MPSPRRSHKKSISSTLSKSKKRSPKRSPKRSLKRSLSIKSLKGSNSAENAKHVKFYDLLAKKPFTTSEYKIITQIISSKNGKRKITYYVTENPTPRKDGTVFENWKILSNVKA